jgi:hypothetical protein
MMNKLMNALLGSCHEATLLMAKKEEDELSFTDGMKLAMHTTLCNMCRNFKKQSAQIARESRNIMSDEVLPELSKERINSLLATHNH